jgi:subtilisin family serine protease
MRRTSLGVAAAVWTLGILLFSLFSVPVVSQAPRVGGREVEVVDGREAIAGEAIVRFTGVRRQGAPVRTVPEADALEALGRTGLVRVRSRSLGAAALLARLRARADVAYAEPNFVVRTFAEPNDPRFPELWGLRNIGQGANGNPGGTPGSDIHTPAAWDLSTGSSNTVVAIIDTGIDYAHPDLAPNMWSAPSPFTVNVGGETIACPAGSHGFNAITLTCNPMDDHNHGTHVAGTIGAAGNNGIGVAGVNWTSRLMGIKFLDSTGSGTVADAIRAVQFAIESKEFFGPDADIRVLSNSWGGGDFSQALLDEINAAGDSDMLFVAAAGNSGFPNDILPTYPASYDAPNIVAVAATTNTDERAFFSNYGANSVHLGAPGMDILSTIRDQAYGFSSGTSMATPHVSGAAALVLSHCTVNTAELKEVLLGTVDRVPSLESRTITGGRLNVHSAMYACTAPPEAPANLTAAGGDTQVRLTWTRVLGATGYRVKRSLTPGGPYALIAPNVKPSEFTDTGVVNGTTYYYVVSAVNIVGESADSNEASATPALQADLTVSSLLVPAVGGPGGSLTVTVTTGNQGLGQAAPTATRFHLSMDASVGPGDLLLSGAQDVPALASGQSVSGTVSVGIPASVGVGQYYLIARSDDDDVLFETSETNNTRPRIVQIGPDLTVSSFTAPGSTTPGASILVSDTSTNQGGGGAAASLTRFYLSTNATLEPGDTQLAGRQVPALAAAATSSGETTLAVPTGLPMGTYYFLAVADGAGAVEETRENNNVASRVVQIGADLLVSALTVPARGGAGATLAITETIQNQGSEGAAASTTRYYVSANATLDAADTLLAGGRAVPALGPGVVNTGSSVVALPSDLATGNYYVIAKADGDGVVAETQEGNNVLARAIAVGPDLTVTAVTMPAKIGAGAVVSITDTTTNPGGGSAPASTTRFYLSANAAFDAGDPLLGERAVAGLAANGASTGTTTVTIPAGIPPGPYYVFARADGLGTVVESSELNNSLIKAVTVGPDLVVQSVTVVSPTAAGAQTQVTHTVQNQGGGAAGESTVRFYLSTNISLDAADVQLAETRAVATLAANASSAATTPVTIPAGTPPGTYFLLVQADGAGVVAESAESNNTGVKAIVVN